MVDTFLGKPKAKTLYIDIIKWQKVIHWHFNKWENPIILIILHKSFLQNVRLKRLWIDRPMECTRPQDHEAILD